MAVEKPSRRRQVNGQRSKLSKWHFGFKNTSSSKKLNDLKKVNEVGYNFSQTKNPDDAEFLLKAFNNYIMKYVMLLSTGKTSPEGAVNKRIHKDTRRFLGLFANGVKSSEKELAAVAARLSNAFLFMDADDIYNELALIFLELANKFDGRGGFTGFIQHRFAWSVKARMFQVQNDPMNYQSMYDDIPEDNEGVYNGMYEIIENENGFSLYLGSDMIQHEEGEWALVPKWFDMPTINYKFITCAPSPFDVLWTKIQRSIIVLKFVEELSNSAIADRLGLGGASAVQQEYKKALEDYKEYTTMISMNEEL